MITLLCGQDTYRLHQKLNEIIEQYKKDHKIGLNLKYFDFEKNNFEDFWQEFRSTPIFSERKLLVIKNPFYNEDSKEKFLKNIKAIANSRETVLFYKEGDISEKDKLLQLLKKTGKFQEFNFLEKTELRNWIKKEFEKLAIKIDNLVLEKLIEFVGNNLWQFSNEIKKIAAYKNGKEITVKDIELLVKPKIEADIFKTIDAMAEKNRKKALTFMHRHLGKGDSPLYLISMINFQIRNLLIVKSQGLYLNNFKVLSNELKLHPYIIKKAIIQARKFSLNELKKAYQKIFKTDLAIKRGKMDPLTALDMLIAEI